METNPHSGINSETWIPATKVMLQINGETGVVVEERVITTSFTPPTAKDEQDVLDETNFIKENV